MKRKMIGDLEEKMANKEIGPVGRVVSDGEAGVLAEASQLFPDFKRCHPSFSLSSDNSVQLAFVGT